MHWRFEVPSFDCIVEATFKYIRLCTHHEQIKNSSSPIPIDSHKHW
uniref:Uncharacterized protein n=1 Tax=Arundo donax TaxID=35708 RepID=A0A0A9DNK8_ARUDO